MQGTTKNSASESIVRYLKAELCMQLVRTPEK